MADETSNTTDTLVVSLLRGRVGAGILAIIAVALGYAGYTISPDQQTAIIDALVMIFSAGSALYALWSKIRELKKNVQK